MVRRGGIGGEGRGGGIERGKRRLDGRERERRGGGVV
jgi:hypothetical protein